MNDKTDMAEKNVHFNPEVLIHCADSDRDIDKSDRLKSLNLEDDLPLLWTHSSSYLNEDILQNIHHEMEASENFPVLLSNVLPSRKSFMEKEKDELLACVTNLKKELKEAERREYEACLQVKKSIAMVEEMKFEKSQTEMARDHLKAEVNNLKSKIEFLTLEHEKNIAQQKVLCSEEWAKKLTNLQSEVDDAVAERAKLRSQLDETSDRKSKLGKEIEFLKLQNQKLETDLKQCTVNTRAQLMDLTLQKDNAVNELSQFQRKALMENQDLKLENEMLLADNKCLRRRLDGMERDYVNAKEECIKIAQTISSTNKTHSSQITMQHSHKDTSTNLIEIKRQKQQLQKMLRDLNIKYVDTVKDLEEIIDSQMSLNRKLLAECHLLNQKLKETYELQLFTK